MLASAMNTFGFVLVLVIGSALATMYSRRVIRHELPARGDDIRQMAKRQKDMAALSRSLHQERRRA